ncbi:hypothetical protein FVEG_15245 [Fusarium verticillioides 7600]|uniref:BTB domain-containing protein n=1 Tax=Gibberella moniliformis (strain M3125 / FGSC 7600) TaxID=334819 RepID=W7LP63_GIBM7|nr:hypothetical protein FVEG_15245 [Fusarium verticillioides 7600]EWG41193.1 hypothetical protein FVEG_15245 [Fusarium verticillioides 7600]
MKRSLLELDPQADALLILQKPNLESSHLSTYGCASARVIGRLDDPVYFEPEEDESAGRSDLNEEMRSLQTYLENGDPNQVVFRVSAKHLCLASPVFRRMIQGQFKESEPNEQGLFEIRTSEWDAEALLIILDIIHGHHSSVPKRPSLDVIAQIGIIADYYDCLEVVKTFFQHWHLTMKIWENYSIRPSGTTGALALLDPTACGLPPLPGRVKPFDDEATIGLFMAWIVQDHARFRDLTVSAVVTTDALVETALPIPAKIFEAIYNQSCQIIDYLVSKIYNLKDDLEAGRVGCYPLCSWRLREVFMSRMGIRGLPMIKPESPLRCYNTVSSVVSIIDYLGYKYPIWRCGCELKSPYNLRLYTQDLSNLVSGLDLNDFL